MDYNKKLQEQIDDIPSFKNYVSASDLRIGNMVFIDNDTIISIDGISEDELHSLNGYDHPSRFKPIPISEEILLHVGFDKKLNGKVIPYDINDIYRIYSDKNIYEFWVLDADYEEIAYCKLCKITYLHQLQNLYFALTGTELDTSKIL